MDPGEAEVGSTEEADLGFIAWLLHTTPTAPPPTTPPFTVVSNFEGPFDKLTGGDGRETGGGRDKTSFKRGRRNSSANAYLSLDANVHEHSRLGQGLLSNIMLEAGATVRRVLVYSAGGYMTMHHDCGRPTAPPPPPPQPMPTMPPPPPSSNDDDSDVEHHSDDSDYEFEDDSDYEFGFKFEDVQAPSTPPLPQHHHRHLLPRHCHLQHNCLQRHCRPSRPTLEESEAMEVVGEGDKPSRHRLLDIVGIGGYANDFTKFAADMEIMIAHVLTFKEITSAEYIEGRIRGLGGLASAKNPLRTLVMRSPARQGDVAL
jgi:hypothetical protein